MKQFKNYRFFNEVLYQWSLNYPDDKDYSLLYTVASEVLSHGIICANLSEDDCIRQMAERFAQTHNIKECRMYVYDKFIWYIVKNKNGRKSIIGLKKIPHNRRIIRNSEL